MLKKYFISFKNIFIDISKYIFILQLFLLLIFLLFLFWMFPSDSAYILCMLYSFLITFFILDDLKLSNIKLMRYIQIIFFAIFIFYILIFMLNYYNISLIETIYCEPISDATSDDTISDLSQNKTTKGWLDSKITHKVDLDTSIKESMKEAAEKVSKSIEKSSDKISNALTTGGIAGATAYVIKGSSLPPLAKAAVVIGSGAAVSLIQNASTTLKNLDKLNSDPNIAHPESPTESVTNEFQVQSPFEFFDLNKLFGVDPDNYLQNFLFSIIGLGFINIFFIFILSITLIQIFIYYNTNLEFKWIDKYLPSKYVVILKNIILKIYKKWNKSNHLLIVFLILLIIIISISTTYFTYQLYINLDKFVDLYLQYKKNL
jgi:hypothetical protein